MQHYVGNSGGTWGGTFHAIKVIYRICRWASLIWGGKPLDFPQIFNASALHDQEDQTWSHTTTQSCVCMTLLHMCTYDTTTYMYL